MVSRNSDKAVKKTTNKIAKAADDSGTRCLNNKKKHISELDIEYVNELHVQDFLKALEYDPINVSPSTSTDNSTEHISAWTDALPSRSTSSSLKTTKKSRRKLVEQEAAKPKGVSHSLMQYPLIVNIIVFIVMS
jgi:hypothetical protein